MPGFFFEKKVITFFFGPLKEAHPRNGSSSYTDADKHEPSIGRERRGGRFPRLHAPAAPPSGVHSESSKSHFSMLPASRDLLHVLCEPFSCPESPLCRATSIFERLFARTPQVTSIDMLADLTNEDINKVFAVP